MRTYGAGHTLLRVVENTATLHNLVSLSVCVCVRERESAHTHNRVTLGEWERVWVCGCVCVRESTPKGRSERVCGRVWESVCVCVCEREHPPGSLSPSGRGEEGGGE